MRLASAGFESLALSGVEEREVYTSFTVAGVNLKVNVCHIQQNVSCEIGFNEIEYFELRNKLHHLLENMQPFKQTRSKAA